MAEQLVHWQKDFELGIASVDHEHLELVNLINVLYAQIEAGG